MTTSLSLLQTLWNRSGLHAILGLLKQITFDRGSKFLGQEFQEMIKNDYGIKPKPISVRNPWQKCNCGKGTLGNWQYYTNVQASSKQQHR